MRRPAFVAVKRPSPSSAVYEKEPFWFSTERSRDKRRRLPQRLCTKEPEAASANAFLLLTVMRNGALPGDGRLTDSVKLHGWKGVDVLGLEADVVATSVGVDISPVGVDVDVLVLVLIVVSTIHTPQVFAHRPSWF